MRQSDRFREKWDTERPAKNGEDRVSLLRYSIDRILEKCTVFYAAPAVTEFKRGKSGAILATINNMAIALRAPSYSGITLGRDLFRDEIVIMNADGDQWQPLADEHAVKLRMLLELRDFLPIGRELFRDALLAVADDNKFDSAIAWLEKTVLCGMGCLAPRIRFTATSARRTTSTRAQSETIYGRHSPGAC
jgi:hypothetical protein